MTPVGVAVARLIAEAPALNPDQRARLSGLLTNDRAAAPTATRSANRPARYQRHEGTRTND